MTVRGAPAIGVAAAGGLALAAREAAFARADDRAAFDAALDEAAAGLAQTRPTAVNLTWAIGELRGLWRRCDAAPAGVLAHPARPGPRDPRRRHPPLLRHRRLRRAALQGRRHHPHPLQRRRARHRRLRHRAGRHPRLPRTHGGAVSVFVDETRPWLQGARLTAWELVVEGIDYSVIADNMAGHFMSAARSTASSSAPTASPPTATPPTRSAPTRGRPGQGARHAVLRGRAAVDRRPRHRRAAPTSPSKSATPARSRTSAAAQSPPDGSCSPTPPSTSRRSQLS